MIAAVGACTYRPSSGSWMTGASDSGIRSSRGGTSKSASGMTWIWATSDSGPFIPGLTGPPQTTTGVIRYPDRVT